MLTQNDLVSDMKMFNLKMTYYAKIKTKNGQTNGQANVLAY